MGIGILCVPKMEDLKKTITIGLVLGQGERGDGAPRNSTWLRVNGAVDQGASLFLHSYIKTWQTKGGM